MQGSKRSSMPSTSFYDEKEKRSFVTLNAISLLFTLIAILSLMVALAAIVVAPIVFAFVGLSNLFSLAIVILRWPLLLVLAAIALAAIYRYGPSRREAQWQWLSVGSAAAAVVWLISSVLFSRYIANFGAYNATYGSLGADGGKNYRAAAGFSPVHSHPTVPL
jgi:membrane protein